MATEYRQSPNYSPGRPNGGIWEAERETAHEPGVAHSGWTDIGPV